MLYWWHWLDQEGFVQFTVCVLDKFQRANSKDFNLVSSEARKQNEKNKKLDIKEAIADNIKTVGNSVATLGFALLNDKINQWQGEKYNLEDLLDDMMYNYEHE